MASIMVIGELYISVMAYKYIHAKGFTFFTNKSKNS
jgi:hypothetical protein